MKHILGIYRFQATFSSLEDTIPKENPVRVIDAFINKLDLDLLGFISRTTDEEQTKKHNPYLDGRPSFKPKSSFHSRSECSKNTAGISSNALAAIMEEWKLSLILGTNQVESQNLSNQI
ncbi:hypothetical protein ACFOUP_16235 [Belliella kenyensis]|uniref:Uncharacterized protein n=1 Tax=Belliella kenyensis TaxID=1472724 RepID=A0ABV8EPG5_9BACT|nr:hypothetical protein [Belliella kenyensis]MCH7403919.1 hypothetical protein [Belliella kenyensis]MDN3602896.1 hypothetical protein [Belliella kenyensis]